MCIISRMLQYESPVERPVMLASFNQEPITTVSNAPQPPICNLKYTAATAQLMVYNYSSQYYH